ncbi:hypothetical protein Nmel_011096 [Mimus melanotis]
MALLLLWLGEEVGTGRGCRRGLVRVAKDMKHRLGFLLQKSDSCDYSSSQGKKEKISSSQR